MTKVITEKSDPLTRREEALLQQLRKLRKARRQRQTTAMNRLASTYANVFWAIQQEGRTLPTPEALAKMLGPKKRRRKT